jgi:hypothetical protein
LEASAETREDRGEEYVFWRLRRVLAGFWRLGGVLAARRVFGGAGYCRWAKNQSEAQYQNCNDQKPTRKRSTRRLIAQVDD